MAKADHKHHGPAAQGKGDGTGAMTEIDETLVPANAVLSNRDKSRHSEDRGLDGRAVLTEQMQDHTWARAEDTVPTEAEPAGVDLDEEDLAAAQLDTSGEGAKIKIADILEAEE